MSSAERNRFGTTRCDVGMVDKVAQSKKLKTSATIATLVTTCVLLAGCGAGPLDSTFGSGASGSEATPQKTDTQTNAGTDDKQPDEQAGADVDAGDAASCLVGTWEEDMKIFTDTVKKTQGTFEADSGVTNISWTGGAYFRFNQNEKFSLWTENLTVSFDLEGTTNRMALNANGGGGYTVGGDTIRWSDHANVESHLRVFENEKLVHKGTDDAFGDFSDPSPFTCAKDTLEMNLDDGTLDPPRVFQRTADRAPKN